MPEWEHAEVVLKEGGVGVLPTDTLYGIVGSALVPETVERIYELKHRDERKPLIVLISDIEMLEQFGVVLSEELMGKLAAYWPGPYTVILPTIDDEFSYLHRGGGTIGFRLPDNDDLRELIRAVGPIVAPSANIEGRPPAKNITEAQTCFGSDGDFYVDGGELTGKPSTILEFDGEKIRTIR